MSDEKERAVRVFGAPITWGSADRAELRIGSGTIGDDWCVSLYGDDGPTGHVFKQADLKLFAEELLVMFAREERGSQ